jgi:hypothetical protein
MRHITHREALCGPVSHSAFDMRHGKVLWPRVWTHTEFYQLYMLARSCTRFYEMQVSQRPDA